MRSSNLASFAICFVLGYGLGFLHHSAFSKVHQEDAVGDTHTRLRSVEARLAQLEARAALPVPAALGSSSAGGGSGASVAAVAAATVERPLVTVHDGAKYKAAAAVPTQAAAAAAATAAVAVHDDGCPPGRKPYHVILTAQDSTYQAWQTRIMYYHFRKLQRANPCTEMTGFTRLLSSSDGRLDELAKEIPTVTAKALEGGNGCRHTPHNSCDMGFPVMNRPHAVTQLLAKLPASVTEGAELGFDPTSSGLPIRSLPVSLGYR